MRMKARPVAAAGRCVILNPAALVHQLTEAAQSCGQAAESFCSEDGAQQPPVSCKKHLQQPSMLCLMQDTDPAEVTGKGPDAKTIGRYLDALCQHKKAQKLVIPVTLASSAAVSKDMLAYVKPGVQVNDALIEQVAICLQCQVAQEAGLQAKVLLMASCWDVSMP